MALLLEPHQHENLPTKTSLRVAEILPGQGDDPISCLLHFVDMSNPQEYEAVSMLGVTQVLELQSPATGKDWK